MPRICGGSERDENLFCSFTIFLYLFFFRLFGYREASKKRGLSPRNDDETHEAWPESSRYLGQGPVARTQKGTPGKVWLIAADGR